MYSEEKKVLLVRISKRGDEVASEYPEGIAELLLENRPYVGKPNPVYSTFKKAGKSEKKEVEKEQAPEKEEKVDLNKLSYPELQKLYVTKLHKSAIGLKKTELIKALGG